MNCKTVSLTTFVEVTDVYCESISQHVNILRGQTAEVQLVHINVRQIYEIEICDVYICIYIHIHTHIVLCDVYICIYIHIHTHIVYNIYMYILYNIYIYICLNVLVVRYKDFLKIFFLKFTLKCNTETRKLTHSEFINGGSSLRRSRLTQGCSINERRRR